MLPSIYPLLDGLVEAIEKEMAILNGLAELFTAERGLVITGDVGAFWTLTKRKQKLQKELTSVVETRDQLIARLCEGHNMRRENLRLRELISASLAPDDPQASSFRALLDNYQSAAERAAEAGLRTQQLLKKSVEYVDHMVKMVSHVNNPSLTYSSNGAMRPGKQSYGSTLSAHL